MPPLLLVYHAVHKAIRALRQRFRPAPTPEG
jgi:hypothetical protein